MKKFLIIFLAASLFVACNLDSDTGLFQKIQDSTVNEKITASNYLGMKDGKQLYMSTLNGVSVYDIANKSYSTVIPGIRAQREAIYADGEYIYLLSEVGQETETPSGYSFAYRVYKNVDDDTKGFIDYPDSYNLISFENEDSISRYLYNGEKPLIKAGNKLYRLKFEMNGVLPTVSIDYTVDLTGTGLDTAKDLRYIGNNTFAYMSDSSSNYQIADISDISNIRKKDTKNTSVPKLGYVGDGYFFYINSKNTAYYPDHADPSKTVSSQVSTTYGPARPIPVVKSAESIIGIFPFSNTVFYYKFADNKYYSASAKNLSGKECIGFIKATDAADNYTYLAITPSSGCIKLSIKLEADGSLKVTEV